MKRSLSILLLIFTLVASGCMTNSEKLREVQQRTALWKGTPIHHVMNRSSMQPTLKVPVMLDKTYLYVFEDPFEGRDQDCVIMALMDANKIVTDVKFSYCGEEHSEVPVYYGYRKQKANQSDYF